ncbi:MAG: GNAT family N-acetyltransferase [Lachnospiraceae bacterium]|nr:GNAT family N-acetyltransferase [Lachnospiraceae bacterium]
MITHKGTQTIYTERLVLRKFTVDDAQAMYENWARDERVTRYLTWCPHETSEVTRQLLEVWCADYDKPNNYNWVMGYSGTPIGNISVVHLNEKSEWAELGYCMGFAYWNKGLMSEAVKAVIDFLFAEVGINRVGISHAVENPASGRIAQKCGLTYEGTKREYIRASGGKFLDISDHGIIRSDWEKRISHCSRRQ